MLGIDLRGFGRSDLGILEDGEPILDRSGDVEAILDYLTHRHGVSGDRVFLVGHSFGAAQVLATLRRLAATSSRRVARAIAIGPADYDVFVQGDQRMADYMAKVESNMGIRLTPEAMQREGARLTPAVLFETCPEVPVTVIVGGQDHGDTLWDRQEKIPPPCRDRIEWVHVPLSNHMYWTEGDTRFRFYRWRLSVSLLVRHLNSVLLESRD